jgi:hypothetical protein
MNPNDETDPKTDPTQNPISDTKSEPNEDSDPKDHPIKEDDKPRVYILTFQ